MLTIKRSLRYSRANSKNIDKRLLTRLNNILKIINLTYLQFCSYTPVKFLKLSIVFSVCKKTIQARRAKFEGFIIYVEAVLYLFLHSLHDRTFNYK